MRLDECGENAWLQRLEVLLGSGLDRVGDDAAWLPWTQDNVVLTSDAVVAGRHFDAQATPEQVGAKAIGRLLSDFAAMGAAPHSALINLNAPGHFPVEWLERCYRSMRERAEMFGLVIRGGDTSAGDLFQLHLFGVGYVSGGRAIARSGAQEGQELWVTGRLGGSLSGHHLSFTPRVQEGLWLRENHPVSAMMDITDGLALDACRLCRASCVGLEMSGDLVPLSEAALAQANPLDSALRDGEDYELLFALPAEAAASLQSGWELQFPLVPLHRIGKFMPWAHGAQLRIGDVRQPLSDFGGFDHFSVDFPT